MNEKDINGERTVPDTEPQIIVNDYGMTKDETVVVEESDRTVVITPNETMTIEKGRAPINMPPANRPRKVYGGMWGATEIAAFGISLITILGVIALYMFFVVPSNRELEQAKADRDRLERERTEARAKYGDITSTQERVAELITSVDTFETNHLPVASNGRTALYQRINSLIVGHGLLNTSGPDFAPLEIIAESANSSNAASRETGRARYQSLFPGVYTTMTVEGSYQSIRRFIREIETGKEFVLISSIELEPSDSRRQTNTAEQQTEQPADTFDARGFPSGAVQSGQVRRPQGRTVGEFVSLRLEMAAYFRRTNGAVLPPVNTAN